MFRAGQEIGIYRLIKRIGKGGFGEVWLAERRAKFVTTKVALKLPLDEQVDHEAIKSEAVLWEQASGHPNVLPIIDADEYNGQIVIVSEYAPDGSLEDLLKKEGVLPIKRAVEMTLGILSGLDFLHSKKIIHRDIKPANILLQRETPRLADFGISRVMVTTAATASMSGTPLYMAPEAFDGKRTIQTDIWSVGVVLYQMLKGVLPFPYTELTELLGAIVMKEPHPLPDFIPDSLREIVFKAISKKPEQRYLSALVMRNDLSNFLIRQSQQNIQQTLRFVENPTQASPTVSVTQQKPQSTTEFTPNSTNSNSNTVSSKNKLFYWKFAKFATAGGFLVLLFVVAVSLLYIQLFSKQSSLLSNSQDNINASINKPIVPEIEGQNIGLLSFETLRRNVDLNPIEVIKQYDNNFPKDAADFYLLGRAYLLTQNYEEAKRAVLESQRILSETEPTIGKLLKVELPILAVVINDKAIRTSFEREAKLGDLYKPINLSIPINQQHLVSFMNKRDQVDKNPSNYIISQGSINDSEGFYLRSRAFLLTKGYESAKVGAIESRNRLSDANVTNRHTLAVEVSLILSIVGDKTGSKSFELELESNKYKLKD